MGSSLHKKLIVEVIQCRLKRPDEFGTYLPPDEFAM
jgi:hypothetical protein